MLNTARDAPSKTRFKMWWRLIGSAIEHAAKLHAGNESNKEYPEIDFQKMFLEHEETEDEDSITLADALGTMVTKWPNGFHTSDVAHLVNNAYNQVDNALREFLYPGAPSTLVITTRSVGKHLKAHVDEPVKSGDRTLSLRTRKATSGADRGSLEYYIDIKEG